MRKKIYLFIMMMLLSVSCNEGSQEVDLSPKGVIFADGTEMSIEFTGSGGTQIFMFTSDLDWEVTTSADWIEATPSSGTPSTKMFVIKVVANDSFENRKGNVTMTTTNGHEYTIEVKQSGADEVFKINDTDEYKVTASGGSIEVVVATNIEYSIEIPEDAKAWLSVTDTRAVCDEILTFTAAANESFDERSATVGFKDTNGKVLQRITFKQSGKEKVFKIDSKDSYIVEATGGNIEINVTTNIEYSIEIPEDAKAWLSIVDTRTTVRNETVIFTLADNSSLYKRNTTVKFVDNNKVLQTIIFKQNGTGYCIAYHTNNGKPLNPYKTDGFGASLVENIFDSTSSKGELVFAENITTIPDQAFGVCENLTWIDLPNGITSIGASAFSGCSSMKEITIPASVTSIGTEAFKGCTGKAYINCNMPDRSVSFNSARFTEVAIGDKVTTVGYAAFENCINLKRVTIPTSVVTIEGNAFYKCESLTSITIPNSVTKIGDFAFFRCASLTKITIPDSVTTIGGSAFTGCTGLASITIGANVSTIEHRAFSACINLCSLYCKATTPPSVGTEIIESWEDFKIYVPHDSVREYKITTGWSEYADYIVGYDFE